MSLTVGMPETNARMSAFEVGCLSLVAESRGTAVPAGTTHFVDGWDPLCGSERVRFVFPGRGPELGATCPECVQAVAVPRQRTSSKPSTARTSSRTTGTTRARRAS